MTCSNTDDVPALIQQAESRRVFCFHSTQSEHASWTALKPPGNDLCSSLTGVKMCISWHGTPALRNNLGNHRFAGTVLFKVVAHGAKQFVVTSGRLDTPNAISNMWE